MKTNTYRAYLGGKVVGCGKTAYMMKNVNRCLSKGEEVLVVSPDGSYILSVNDFIRPSCDVNYKIGKN